LKTVCLKSCSNPCGRSRYDRPQHCKFPVIIVTGSCDQCGRRAEHPARHRTVESRPESGAARRRLLLEGPIVSTILGLAVPNVVVNVVLIAVTASVDAHFVGQLDPSALAGLSLVFPLLMLMQQVANSSMGGAVASAIARAIGSGRHEDASALVVHGLVIACGMAAVFASVLLVAGPTVYALMGGSGSTLAAAVEYSNAIFAGALAYWILSTLTSVVRGTGQAIVLAVVYIAAEILHVLLVPTLVFGIGPIPALGITGAGIATVASFTVSTLVLGWYLVSGRTPVTFSLQSVRLNWRALHEILRVGAPMSLPALAQQSDARAAHGVRRLARRDGARGFRRGRAARIRPLSTDLRPWAGLLAMVGTNIGAGQPARAARIAWTGAALAAGVTGASGCSE